MTMVKFSDIQDAFFFVSSASYGMHSAILNKDTGQLYYRSEMGDLDEISEEELDWGTYIDIPHRNDVGLGQELVLEFVEQYLPDELDRIHSFFQKRGAYSRYKNLLEARGLLQRWNDFESEREEEVLREWCEENEIEISG
jgi:hypothetical protein